MSQISNVYLPFEFTWACFVQILIATLTAAWNSWREVEQWLIPLISKIIMKPRKDAKNTEVNNNVKKEAVSQRNMLNLKHFSLKNQISNLARVGVLTHNTDISSYYNFPKASNSVLTC